MTLPRDTSPDAAAAHRRVFRSMTGPDRLELACQMSDELRSIAQEGVAHREATRSERRIESEDASAERRPGR